MLEDNILILNGLKLYLKEDFTGRHSYNVGLYTSAIIEMLLMTPFIDEQNYEVFSHPSAVLLAGVFHDIGKLNISSGLIEKKEKLTDDEFSELKKHPEYGLAYFNNSLYSMSKEIKLFHDAILYHHERWDGKGYPKGLSGEQIPLIARIIAIADSFDAMTYWRPYHNRLKSYHEALVELKANSGTQFDPFLIEILEKKIDEGLFKIPDAILGRHENDSLSPP